MIRATIDTNVFVYMLDGADPKKQAAAVELVARLRDQNTLVSLQACGELYAVVTRKLRRAPWEAAQAARNVMTAFGTFGATEAAVERALSEAAAGRFQYWDGLLLASAHEAGIQVCFSEDMADGARLGEVEVVAPFGPQGLSDRASRFLRHGSLE